MDPDGRYRDKPAKSLAEWRKFPCFVYDPTKAVLVTGKHRAKLREKHRAFRLSLMPKKADVFHDHRSYDRNIREKKKRQADGERHLEHQTPSCRKSIQVFVKTPLNSTLTLQYPLHTTVQELQEAVAQQINLAKNKFDLVGAHNLELCPLLTLEDHGLNNESNIQVRLKGGLRGGADKPVDKDTKDSAAPKDSGDLEPSNVEYGEEIGEGGFGTVYRVTFKKPVKGYTTAAAKSVVKFRKEEIDILTNVDDHCNIVKLIGSYKQVPNNNVLFFELATGGSLSDYLDDIMSKPLPLDLVKKWLTESAQALKYLHENKIIHRDIKPSNCLLFDDLVVKLCDFGLARELDDLYTYSSQKGTHRYMAPEIHKNRRFSRFSDIYAYGMLALHIYTRKEPFEGLEWQCVVFRVPSEDLKPDIPKRCPKDLTELITQCISTDPADRPDVVKILAMDFLRELPKDIINWDKHDVKTWLRQIGVSDAAANRLFKENVDGDVLVEYTANDLIADFGDEDENCVKRGDARKIVQNVNRLKSNNPQLTDNGQSPGGSLQRPEELTSSSKTVTTVKKTRTPRPSVRPGTNQDQGPSVIATTSQIDMQEMNGEDKVHETHQQLTTENQASTSSNHMKQPCPDIKEQTQMNSASTQPVGYPGGARPKNGHDAISSVTKKPIEHQPIQDFVLSDAGKVEGSDPDLERKLRMLLLGNDQELIGKGYYPILVANKPSTSFLAGSEEEKNIQMRFIRDIEWTSVLDLYSNSKSDGLCQYFENERSAILQLPETLNDDDPTDDMEIPDIPLWLFCNGRTDDKNLDGHEPMNIQKWNQNRSHSVEEAISKYSRLIPSQRAVIVFLILSDHDIDILGEIFRKFSSAFQVKDITCIIENVELYNKWADEVSKRSCSKEELRERSCVGNPMSHVNNIIRKIANVDETGPYNLVVDAKETCILSERARSKWSDVFVLCSNQCENTSKKEGDYDFEAFRKATELAFYRGGTVDWWNFRLSEEYYNNRKGYNHVLKRSGHDSLKRKMQDALDGFKFNRNTYPVVTFTISHQPGSGGTTMGRHILWHFHRKYRCLVVNKVTENTTKQILELYHYGYTKKQTSRVPLIVQIEGDLLEVQHLVRELVEIAERDLDNTDVFCAVLHCHRNADINPSEKQENKHYSYMLTQKLDATEREWFAKKYVELEQQRLDDDEINPDKLLGFMLMKEEFSRDYLTRIVSEILTTLGSGPHLDEEFSLMKYTALLTHFDCGAIPIACCDEIMTQTKRHNRTTLESFGLYSRTSHKKVLWEKAMSATAQMVLLEKCLPEIKYTSGIVLAHKCLAGEILAQLEEDGNRDGNTLFNITRELLGSKMMHCRSHGKQYLKGMVKQLLIRRKKFEYGDKENTRFSELILAIDTKDTTNGNNALKILHQGFETLADPMVAQQAARLCYLREKYTDYEKALEYIEKALKLARKNSYLWDTKGQIFKSQMLKTVSAISADHQLATDQDKEIILLARQAMDTFHESQNIALSEAHENNVGFFNEIDVAFRLLEFMQDYVRPFNDKKDGANLLKAYLLDGHVPVQLKKESWRDINAYMSNLKERVYKALLYIDDYLVLTRMDKQQQQQQQDIRKRDDFYESYKEWFGEYRPLEVQVPLDLDEARRRKVITLGAYTFHQVFDHLRAERFQILKDVRSMLELNDPKTRSDLLILVCVSLAQSSKRKEQLQKVETVYKMVRELYETSRDNDLYSALFMMMFDWVFGSKSRGFHHENTIKDRVNELNRRWEDRYRFQNTKSAAFRSPHHQSNKQLHGSYKRKSSTYFFLAKGDGLERLIHIYELSKKFDREVNRDAFWANPTLEERLPVLKGTLYSRTSLIYSPPNSTQIHIRLSRPMSSRVSQESVTFYLGFSSEGPVAYNVKPSGGGSADEVMISYDMSYAAITSSPRQQRADEASESSQQLYRQMKSVKRELLQIENRQYKRNGGDQTGHRQHREKKKKDLEKKYWELEERYKKAIHADID